MNPLAYIALEETTIHCDTCHWEKEILNAEVPEYLNYHCPNCGAVVIDQEDVDYFHRVEQMTEAVKNITSMFTTVTDNRDDIKEDAVELSYKVNSANAKKPQPVALGTSDVAGLTMSGQRQEAGHIQLNYPSKRRVDNWPQKVFYQESNYNLKKVSVSGNTEIAHYENT